VAGRVAVGWVAVGWVVVGWVVVGRGGDGPVVVVAGRVAAGRVAVVVVVERARYTPDSRKRHRILHRPLY